jgi:hypothetical protein
VLAREEVEHDDAHRPDVALVARRLSRTVDFWRLIDNRAEEEMVKKAARKRWRK